MSSKHLMLLLGTGLFLTCQDIFSQLDESRNTVENDKPRVLASGESIKVIAAENFPESMACDIYLGQPRDLPWISIEGKEGLVEDATIHLIDASKSETTKGRTSILNKGVTMPSVSVVRKETERESYILCFFLEDRDGKTVALFDFNLDGQWDVKKTPTREQRAFIFIENGWHEVDGIDALRSAKPIAKRGGSKFEFEEIWKPVIAENQNRIGIEKHRNGTTNN